MRSLLLLLALCPLLFQPSAAFIKVYGTSFADENCREFAWVGANTWRMLEAQAGTTGVELNGKNPVTNLLDNAAALNLTMLRVFATGVTPELPLQVEEGTYNQVALKALDQVVADSADRGLHLLLILARNWGGPDSRAQYASWNGLKSPDDFYTSPAVRQAYKAHLDFMINRANTVNGRTYRDDPTIFGWNLMNEPRYFLNESDPCAKDPKPCADNLQIWIEEMAGWLKSLDPNHLVTVGEEGFWGPGSPQAQNNPQPSSSWAQATGQDFVPNHSIDSIDFAGIHIWPDNWNITEQAFLQRWIDTHMAAARDMNKPLIIEEFGKNVTDQELATIQKERNPTFQTVMGALNRSLGADDVLKAAMFWMYDPVLVDKSSPGWGNYSQDQVFTTSSTMRDIIAPTARLAAQYKAKVPGCTPQTTQAPAGRKLLHVPMV